MVTLGLVSFELVALVYILYFFSEKLRSQYKLARKFKVTRDRLALRYVLLVKWVYMSTCD